MKTLTTFLAVGALALAPKPAIAHNDGIAALGGFVGGVIVGANLERCPAPVVVCPPPYLTAPQVVVGVGPVPYDGCWREVTVRVWVPECWGTRRDIFGRHERYFVPGHFEFRPERVWVDARRPYGRDDHARGHRW